MTKLHKDTEANMALDEQCTTDKATARSRIAEITEEVRVGLIENAAEPLTYYGALEQRDALESAWRLYEEGANGHHRLYKAQYQGALHAEAAQDRKLYQVIKGKLRELIEHHETSRRLREEQKRMATQKQAEDERHEKLLKAQQDDWRERNLANKAIRLPELVIPKFTGNFKEWRTFRDIYLAATTGQKITGVQKMTLLRANLGGSALEAIAALPITAEGLDAAWVKLGAIYDDSKELFRSYAYEWLQEGNVVVGGTGEELLKVTCSTQNFLQNGAALRASKQFPAQWFMIAALERRLDSETLLKWQEEIIRITTNAKPPRDVMDLEIQDLCEFLEQRAKLLMTRNTMSVSSAKEVKKERGHQGKGQGNGRKGNVNTTTSAQVKKCACCAEGDHNLWKCAKFLGMSTSERSAFVQANEYCFRCLSRGHRVATCKSVWKCKDCKKAHHFLLHITRDEPKKTESEQPSTISTANVTMSNSQGLLLTTAVVEVQDKSGAWVKCRALFDEAADVNCVSEECARRLGLQRKKTNQGIGTITSDSQLRCSQKVRMRMRSRVDKSFIADHDAVVVGHKFGKLPQAYIVPTSWKFLEGLELADPEFNVPGKVDILLNVGVVTAAAKKEVPVGDGVLLPLAYPTRFGWILRGPYPLDFGTKKNLANFHRAEESGDVLEKFWTTEEVGSSSAVDTRHDACSAHFESTFRLENKRFIVRIPFTEKRFQLGESYGQALKRLQSLVGRMSRNPALKEATIKFMSQYEELGHMTEVPPADGSRSCVYLPHHAVIKETSTTTKHRQVFDGSASTSTGLSVNQAQMVGPTVQGDLWSLLIKLRFHRIALTGDVAMMYRQILVAEEDRDYQRILWRASEEDPIKEYQLNTVTYGTASAPYLAIACLRKLAELEEKNHPIASRIALEDFYVDDLVTGASTEREAKQLFEDMTAMLEKGSFQLRKWATNSQEVLDHIPVDLQEKESTTKFEDASTRALGVKWIHKADVFSFDDIAELGNMDLASKQLTKRMVSSAIAKIFDPLGLLSPVVIAMKMMLQDLWKERIGWDDQVSEDLQKKFCAYYERLSTLARVQVPRCVVAGPGAKYFVHGFSDASEKAYGACLYLVVEVNGVRTSKLIASKTKVAPIDKLTIPRLELLGALLLARLWARVKLLIPFEVSEVYAWTDSTVALWWIRTQPSGLKEWVANRVTQIAKLLDPSFWRHVRGVENPADLASRGLDPEEMFDNEFWWNGPAWLQDEELPAGEIPGIVEGHEDFAREKKKIKPSSISHTELAFVDSTNSYWRMIRRRAWVSRAINNMRSRVKTVGPLTVEELRSAKVSLIRAVQREAFSEEYESLVRGKNVSTRSKLKKLAPFVRVEGDKDRVNESDGFRDGLIRVGGRLEHAGLKYEQRHPIILPANHAFTKALVNAYHFKTLHGGPTLLQGVLSEEFWICRGRDLCRQVTWSCMTCAKAKAAAVEQYMGDLPLDRIKEARPFTTTGVDYAGPMDVRNQYGRSSKPWKGYIAVFVCFATKAIHLEFVGDLSTAAFIAAFRRFSSTRGLPANVWSDNGTNFVGAEREFKEIAESDEVYNEVVKDGTTWNRNPPGAPHFGGLWEAGVKSVKRHLYRAFHGCLMNFEQWSTALKQIEACLNSRPLVPLPSDSEELTALTPGHFLIGSSLVSAPDEDFRSTPDNRLTAWQRVQRRLQFFWERWRKEYLATLQQRPKWWIKRKIEVGAYVLLKGYSKPGTWDLAVITEVFPGQDGVVRAVKVKKYNPATGKADRIYMKPVSKICILPLDGEFDVERTVQQAGGCSGESV